MPSNSTGSAPDAKAFEIAESRVPADQPASIRPIHSATSRRTSFLLPSQDIFCSKLSIRRRNVATMETRDTIRDTDVCSAPLLSDLHVTLARYARIDITWDQLEQQPAARSNFSMSNCADWTSGDCDLFVIVVLKLHLLLIIEVCSD